MLKAIKNVLAAHQAKQAHKKWKADFNRSMREINGEAWKRG